MQRTMLTSEQIVDLRRIQSLDVSCTGSIAYSFGPNHKTKAGYERAIWMVNAADGEPRQLTYGHANDVDPRWSPDGTSLAFLSLRHERGNAQLYLLSMAGGEARQLTFGKKSIVSYAWSPDGKHIAFINPDDPDDETRRRDEENDDARVFGERWEFARLRIVDIVSGEIRTVLTGERHVDALSWRPDSDGLVCIVRATPELDARWSGNCSFVEIAADGSAEREICMLHGNAGEPCVSLDAKWVLFGRSVTGGAQSSQAVWRVPLAGGDPALFAGGVDSCIPAFHRPMWSNRALCTVLHGLDTRLEWLDSETGDLELLYSPNAGDLTASAVTTNDDGTVLAVALTLPDRPAEIYAGPADSLRRRTDHHAPLADIRFGASEDFRWKSHDGLSLDGILILPPGATTGRPLPTIVLVHGGPYGRWGRGCQLDWGYWGQWLAWHGYAALLPNPRGGCGHGEDFAGACRGAVGRGDWNDVLSCVDAAIERGITDPDRLGIGGWSQGGFMTAWAVTQTDRFKAGIDGAGPSEWGWMAAESDMSEFEAALGGSLPWDGPGPHPHQSISPLSYAGNVRTPTLILHGEKDERVPLSQATAFYRALRQHGVKTGYVVYPREPHPIQERAHQIDVLARVRDWFLQHIPVT